MGRPSLINKLLYVQYYAYFIVLHSKLKYILTLKWYSQQNIVDVNDAVGHMSRWKVLYHFFRSSPFSTQRNIFSRFLTLVLLHLVTKHHW